MDKFECLNCKKESDYHIETPVVDASGNMCGFRETIMGAISKGQYYIIVCSNCGFMQWQKKVV